MVTAEENPIYDTGQNAVGIPRQDSQTDSCSNAQSCSPGTIQNGWACGTPTTPGGYTMYVEDKRSDYTLYPAAYPVGAAMDAGWPYEIALVQRGVTSYTGAEPPPSTCTASGQAGLECESYTYSYPAPNFPRLPATTSRPSVVSPSVNVGTTKTYVQQNGGNVLSSVIQSGYSENISGTAALQYVGTFYFTGKGANTCYQGASDPLNRVLEKHGPCLVKGNTSVDCDLETTFPITELTYWPAGNGTQSGRLESESRMPNGCTGAPGITTTYNQYDAYGNATSVSDSNGVTTTYTYAGKLMTSKTVSESSPSYSATTNYGYESGVLTSVQLPEGNFEVYCHETGTSPGSGCAGGTFTPLLQWRAKAADQLGKSWSEAATYAYWPDGTVETEIFEDATGQRRERQYQKDAQKRPTWEAWGSPASYQQTRSFDGADNRQARGLPFTGPPAFCGAGGGDPTCQQMASDAANRLTSVSQTLPGQTSPTLTRMAYDTNGNVCAVTVGASSSWAAAGCTVTDPQTNRSRRTTSTTTSATS
ncbi:MAG: hypothetical protein ACYCWW_02485 [Deltaproteobacteria bacterium]